MKPVHQALAIGGVLGGFIGGYATDSTFSLMGALLGAPALLGLVFLVGRKLHETESKKKLKQDLPPEMRAVFDRMTGKKAVGETGPCAMCGQSRSPNDGYMCKSCSEFLNKHGNKAIVDCGGCGAGFFIEQGMGIFSFEYHGVTRKLCACCCEHIKTLDGGENIKMPPTPKGYDDEGQRLNTQMPDKPLLVKVNRRENQAQLRAVIKSKSKRTGEVLAKPLFLEDNGATPEPKQKNSIKSEERPFDLSLEGVIANLARQHADAAARGERLETMLIPHIRIKLDILIKSFQKDRSRVIDQIEKSTIQTSEKSGKIEKIKQELAELLYNLKREKSSTIVALFDKIRGERPMEFEQFEVEVRAENPSYSIVEKL